MNDAQGHRDRLRQKYLEAPTSLSDEECLELLLTYAIARKDVAPLARELMAHFGGLAGVLYAPVESLIEFPGIGKSTATFLKLISNVWICPEETQEDMSKNKPESLSTQLPLFEPGNNASSAQQSKVKERQMRVFANDEITNTLDFLPKAPQFETLDGYKQFLNEKLPYNALETRYRRSRNITERFFPEDNLAVPLTSFLSEYTMQADLKPVIFYHILKAEPIAAKVAEELVWPALPTGQISRDQMREFILRYLPEASESSLKNMLRALFYTYDLLGVGSAYDKILRFQLHQGTLESFLFILTSEYPQPGIYSFDSLFNGPLHRWMLWDRQWIRQQIYNLQDFGILSKVSEIDTVRQFTLAVDQPSALRMFFEHPERSRIAIREQAEPQDGEEEA